MHFLSGKRAVQDTAAQQRIHSPRNTRKVYRCKLLQPGKRTTIGKQTVVLAARTHSPSRQSFLSCVSWFSWFTSPTVDWAEAKLPWSQQEHLARQAATVTGPNVDRQGRQEYLVARIFLRDQIKKITDQRSRRTR
jgi:hypothetical protein